MKRRVEQSSQWAGRIFWLALVPARQGDGAALLVQSLTTTAPNGAVPTDSPVGAWCDSEFRGSASPSPVAMASSE